MWRDLFYYRKWKILSDAFSPQMFYTGILACRLPYFNLRIDKTSFCFEDVKSTGSTNKEELCAKENHALRQMYYMAAAEKLMILCLHKKKYSSFCPQSNWLL